MPQASSFGFGPEARISSRKDFQRVFSDGGKLAGRNAVLWFYRTPSMERQARLGLSVSAKVGIAVRRNRLKRLTREAFRRHRRDFKQGVDMVVYLRPGCRWEGLESAETDLLNLCRKAGLLIS